MEMHIGLSGSYELTVRNQEGEITKQLAFENLILNQGLDSIGTEAYPFPNNDVKCKLGTGSVAPAVTDTDLSGTASGFSSDASGANVTGNITTPPYWSECSYAMTFPIGALSGNYTEIGLYSHAGTLFSRALIKDSGGNPTTLTILATEELHVVYKLRMYPPMTDTTGTFSMTYNGTPTTYNYTIRYANFIITDTYPFTVFSTLAAAVMEGAALSADITGDMTYNQIVASDTSVASTYMDGTYYRDITYGFETSTANFTTGITGIRFNASVFDSQNNGWSHSQCLISPPIMKTATDTLSLTFRISWGRV